MNRIMKLALCGAFLILLLAAPGMAATYSFGDLYKEWPSIDPTTTTLSHKDTHGNPLIERVELTTHDNGSLDMIKIVFDKQGGVGLSNSGDFNSLFINSSWSSDTAPDIDWDFYIRGVYTGNGYQVSFYSLTEPWEYTIAGFQGFRNGHPNGIDPKGNSADPDPASKLTFAVNYGDYLNDSVLESDITYRFADSVIFLDSSFVIGYTPYCANDVFLAPVPEPATFVLLGAGLALGLCVLRGRKTAAGV